MTPRERSEWMAAVLASELTPGAKCVAIRLVLHLNMETGRCDPSMPRLAAGVGGVTTRSIERCLAQLEKGGWIWRGGRQGTSNHYRILMRPPTETSGVCDDTPDTDVGGWDHVPPTWMSGVGILTPDRDVTPPPTPVSGDPRPRCRPNREENKEENREERLYRHDIIDDDPADGAIPSPAESFEAWWAHYPRKVAKGGARKAYDRVLRSGEASAEDLLAGVMRYAAERTGQEERYTKHPATWLNQGCWTDTPLGSAASEAPLADVWRTSRPGPRDIRTMSNLEIALAGLEEDQ